MPANSTHENKELLQGQNYVLELIARGAPLRQVLDLLLDLIQTHCPGMSGSILLLDSDGIHVRHASAPRLPHAYIEAIDGAPIGPCAGSCGTAMYRREAVVVADIATDPLWGDYRQLALPFGLRACWSTPIFDAEGGVLGSFAMYFGAPGRPDDACRQLTELATHIASIAISQHRAAQEIERREAQLIEAQQLANVGSYEWDVAANRVSRSEELCRIFGVARRDFEPTYEGYLARVHPEDRAANRSIIEAALRDSKPFDFEERIVRPDGAIRVLQSRGRWTADAAGAPVRLVGICQDITERRQAEEQLRALSARLIDAQEQERIRLARELHDDLSQEIAALSIAAANLKRSIAQHDPDAQAQGDRIQHKLMRMAERVRRLSHHLHPSVLQHSALNSALKSYCAEFSALTGLRVSFESEGSFDHLPKAVGLCVYRVAQEALQNVLKHASVDEARVVLAARPDSIRLTVSDRGAGIDPQRRAAPGLGIVSLKERARLINGAISIESRPNQGTTLTLTAPLPAAPPEESIGA